MEWKYIIKTCFVLQKLCLMFVFLSTALEVTEQSHFKCQKLRNVYYAMPFLLPPLPPWLEAVCFQEVCSQQRSLKWYNLHPEALRLQTAEAHVALKHFFLVSDSFTRASDLSDSFTSTCTDSKGVWELCLHSTAKEFFWPTWVNQTDFFSNSRFCLKNLELNKLK